MTPLWWVKGIGPRNLERGFCYKKKKSQSLSDVDIGYKLLITKGNLECVKKSLSRVFP
jgi:hypothetical protein